MGKTGDPDRSLRSRRSILRDLAFATLVTIMILAAAEGILRLALPDRTGLAKWRNADLFYLDLLWIPDSINSTPLGRGMIQQPFVDGERRYSEQAPPGTVRVLCMGGSVTVGIHYPPADAYPRQIEVALNEKYRLPADIQVINGGKGGSSSYTGLFFLQQIYTSYHPDVVTVCYGVNDAGSSDTIGLLMTERQYVRLHRLIESHSFFRSARNFLEGMRMYALLNQGIHSGSSCLSIPGLSLSIVRPCRPA